MAAESKNEEGKVEADGKVELSLLAAPKTHARGRTTVP